MPGTSFLKNAAKPPNELMPRSMYDAGSGVLRFAFTCASAFGSAS
jgi:hypothetical protein